MVNIWLTSSPLVDRLLVSLVATNSLGSITVRVDAWVKLVQQVAVVWAGSVLGGSGASSGVRASNNTMLSMDSTTIAIRVDAWISLVGDVGVVWASSGRVPIVAAGDASVVARVTRGVGVSESGTSIAVRVDSWVGLVGDV